MLKIYKFGDVFEYVIKDRKVFVINEHAPYRVVMQGDVYPCDLKEWDENLVVPYNKGVFDLLRMDKVWTDNFYCILHIMDVVGRREDTLENVLFHTERARIDQEKKMVNAYPRYAECFNHWVQYV